LGDVEACGCTSLDVEVDAGDCFAELLYGGVIVRLPDSFVEVM